MTYCHTSIALNTQSSWRIYDLYTIQREIKKMIGESQGFLCVAALLFPATKMITLHQCDFSLCRLRSVADDANFSLKDTGLNLRMSFRDKRLALVKKLNILMNPSNS